MKKTVDLVPEEGLRAMRCALDNFRAALDISTDTSESVLLLGVVIAELSVAGAVVAVELQERSLRWEREEDPLKRNAPLRLPAKSDG